MRLKPLAACFLASLATACTTTNSEIRPAVVLSQAAEEAILNKGAALIEASPQAYSLTATRILSATISEPYPERNLFTSAERRAYCVEMRLDTLIFATPARAKISIEGTGDTPERLRVEVSRNGRVFCRSKNPRSFDALIAAREGRRAREAALYEQRLRETPSSPAQIR